MRCEKNKLALAAHLINELANVQLKKMVSNQVVNRQPAIDSQLVESIPTTLKQQGHAYQTARLKTVG